MKPIKIKGKVIHGKKLGRKIGFKTANIEYKSESLEGATFKLNILIENKILKGVGTYMKEQNIFEAHIFDFDKEIYGEEIEIIVISKIRDNKKFENLEEIKKQIQIDSETAKKTEIRVITFGTFDLVHKGHEYYLKESKKYGDKLITVVATDKNVENFKGNKPENDYLKRMNDVCDLKISDTVISGKEKDNLSWIREFSPQVVCVGYDQIGFLESLKKIIKEKNLEIEIIRIEPYKKNIYKSSKLKGIITN